MKSTETLLPEGRIAIVFRGDEILACFVNGIWEGEAGWSPETPKTLGPGEYLLGLYGAGDVGDGYVGLKYLHAFRFAIQEALDLPRGPIPKVIDALLGRAGDPVALSEGQKRGLVAHIRRQNRYWWDNATAELKAILTGLGEDPGSRG